MPADDIEGKVINKLVTEGHLLEDAKPEEIQAFFRSPANQALISRLRQELQQPDE